MERNVGTWGLTLPALGHSVSPLGMPPGAGSSARLCTAAGRRGLRAPPSSWPPPPSSASGQRLAQAEAARPEGARSPLPPSPARSGGPGGQGAALRARGWTRQRGQGGGGRLGAGRAGSGRAGRTRIGWASPRDGPLIGRGAGGGVGCGGSQPGEVRCGPAAPRLLLSERQARPAPSHPRGAAGPRDARSAREPWSASGTSWAAAMGAPVAASGPGAAGPAGRAAPARGVCSRARGSSTSSRSRSARGPWRSTTPSRSSRTASPSTARSSSSARTTSSANTPSASPSGHILPGAGPGGGWGRPRSRGQGPARRAASTPRRVWEGRPGRGAGAGAGRERRPVAIFPGVGGGCALGRGASGRRGEEGAGRRSGLSPRAACACLCVCVCVCVVVAAAAAGAGWTLGGAPCPWARPFAQPVWVQSARPAWRAPEGESVSV